MARARSPLVVLAAALALALGVSPTAAAGDPGRWVLTGASSVPVTYWQGLTSDPRGESLYLTGIFEGLWHTTPLLRETAGVPNAIPPAVEESEGYNHIGDPTWDPGEGGRVLLPLECFDPATGDNTCGTGAFGVADPATLDFRYYVKLDPAEIPKAMWAETAPNGARVWTSSGDDLLAYRSSEISEANSAPAGPLLQSVRRLEGAVPPTGITGAVFRGDRLFLAGESAGVYRVWAVDPRSGERRLELELRICGESEGLDLIPTLGGTLHWLIAPFDPGCSLTFGPTSALLHFVPARGRRRLKVEITHTQVGELPGRVRATVRVRSGGRPLRGAQVSFAGAKDRTNGRGIATVSRRLELPGRFKALARKGRSYGLSRLAPVGLEPGAVRGAVPRSGAG
jgi:hypothetical protein